MFFRSKGNEDELFHNYLKNGHSALDNYPFQYKKAEKEFTKAISLQLNLPGAYSGRARSKFLFKDYPGAIEDYSKEIKLFPNNYANYFYRGETKFHLEQYQDAIKDYSKTIELNPNYEGAYVGRGLVKENLEDYQGAIEDYSKTIELNQKSINTAYHLRAKLKIYLEDYQGAIEDYTKLIEIDKPLLDSKFGYIQRGFIKNLIGNYEDALIDLSKSNESDQFFSSVLYQRGICKGGSGKKSRILSPIGFVPRYQ